MVLRHGSAQLARGMKQFLYEHVLLEIAPGKT